MNKITGICPVCDAQVSLNSDVETSEVVSCYDCKTKLFIENIAEKKAVLKKAPEVEEDWGE